ncbi:peptidylprolyl isomerase [Roseimarinus sediminis]|uniref:peptidylprolyl isomerase n=1 Tax=Roseimarinus sediminis TaxID=1610899 RepID=UPI003D1A3833
MKRYLSFLLFMLLATTLLAGKNVIVTISDHQFTLDEYERIYRKNNTQLNDERDVKSPKEYLDLFVNYKLKVIEAENKGYDTIQAFIDELEGYRKELAKPYLTDVSFTDSMVKTAYFRTINHVKASHILLNVAPNASPEDTLQIYQRIIDIRNQALSGEKTFAELAVAFSEDPSAQTNMGDLGYFKAFNMITEFENTAYNTPVGEISMPVRTQYGYHIIQVNDLKRNEGEVKVAHIMKMFNNRNEVNEAIDQQYKKEADSLYQLLLDGADFAELAAKHSDDRGSKNNGGEMQWISETFSVKPFVEAAFALEDSGSIAPPVRTPYGWHIIKMIDRRPPPKFEDIKEELTQKVKADPARSKHSQLLFINKLKENYGYESYAENLAKLNESLDTAGQTLNYFPEVLVGLPLYKVGDSVFTTQSFIDYLTGKKVKAPYAALRIKDQLKKYNDDVLIQYEDSKLEAKYPEFAQIMEEYHDGMLLFAIMQDEVWDRAVEDTLGLESYYQNNKGTYLWEKHFDGLLIECETAEAASQCRQLIDQGFNTAESLKNEIQNAGTEGVKIETGKWEKGDNEMIDFLHFNVPQPDRADAEKVFTHGMLVEAGKAKTLDEARGLYISDYQQLLEEAWIAQLREQHPVKVNKRLLKKVKAL